LSGSAGDGWTGSRLDPRVMDSYIPIVRARRRKRRPIFFVLLLLVSFGGVVFLWVDVFTPLFEDPDRWVEKNREFRHAVIEVVTGRALGTPALNEFPDWPGRLSDSQIKLLACAQGQVALGVKATGGYHSITYPWGDLANKRLGTSPDLIIRCLRDVGLDLQQLIHIDRVRHPSRYPLQNWANRRPDKSIDHRRLPNMYEFFKQFATQHTTMTDSLAKLARFEPGDLVFWLAQKGGEYPAFVGIVTDRRDSAGVPHVITLARDEKWMSDNHNVTDWQVMGHFHVEPDALLERFLEENPGAPLQPKT
jgi:uncharacterized protein